MTDEVKSNDSCVFLELHLLAKVSFNEYSAPYRLLQFKVNEFRERVLKNNCILPKELFKSRCKHDYIPTYFQVTTNNNKSKFSKLYVKTYIDFNSYFTHLYRNMDYRPDKMFMIAFYNFIHGLKMSLYVLSDTYDLFYERAICTLNIKEPFYLMSFLLNQYRSRTLENIDSSMVLFENRVQLFYDQSIHTYENLNIVSLDYTDHQLGGIVCGYALAKSFHSLKASDIINNSSKKYRAMTNKFKKIIEYNERKKYEQIDKEIRSGITKQIVDINDLTRYILKYNTDPLFGLKIKKGDLKIKLQSAMLKYYGTIPPPHIEFRPTSLLSEMMAGAYNNENQFASVQILNLKPFRPILVKNKDREFLTLTLNGLNIDKPIPSNILNRIEKHMLYPTIDSYINYSCELVDHIEKNEYYYHETINPFLPIYTLSVDIDIYDSHYHRLYYESECQWEIKEDLFCSLKDLVLYVLCIVMEQPVSEQNTTFFLYESARYDLHKIGTKKFKLGLRFIVKLTTICFMNRKVVDNFLKILNMYRYRYEHLRNISDNNIFDEAVYGQRNHEIRLPMNLKSDGSKALVPIFFKCHRSTFTEALLMTNALVHCKNTSAKDKTVHFIQSIPIPTAAMLDEVGEVNIYKNIYSIKTRNTEDLNNNVNTFFKSYKFSDKQKRILIDVIDRFSMGRLKSRENRKIVRIFENNSLQYSNRNKFTWVFGLKFCAISDHQNASRNPCNYFVRLKARQKFSKRKECYVYCQCFSTSCKEITTNFCIAKCML